MNMETLQEAYRQLQRDYIKAQNKLQDIEFVLEDAVDNVTNESGWHYINRITNKMERD
tara:strand:+ start:110 stop:283 length:174 start_codon:yes stop_codon:yes gene_type:complete